MIQTPLGTKLSELHTKAPEHSFAYTKKTIERAFGRKLLEIFENFEEKNQASGSIAQVHGTGQQAKPIVVAVKGSCPFVHPAVLVETYEQGECVDDLQGHNRIKSALARIGTHALWKMLLDLQVEEAFAFCGTPEGDLVHPGECMQQLLEKFRLHRVNVDGNVCTIMVTTLVLEGWQGKLDPDSWVQCDANTASQS
ncbi:hypothetical protein CerSpe_125470 [Prunus speciosa]